MGNNAPSARRWAMAQYVEGSRRGIEVGLRVAKQLSLPAETTVDFLAHLASVLARMQAARDHANPVIDRAVATTLQEMNSKQFCLL